MSDDNKLSPSVAARLLRAMAGKLEAQALEDARANGTMRPVTALAADVALVAALLADEIERRG